MISYFFTYLYLVFNSLNTKKFSKFSILLTLFILIIFIGLRYEIGVDWEQYLDLMYQVKGDSLIETLGGLEPGYKVLNFIGAQFNNIYIVNSLSALIFLIGLIFYSNKQTYPWLSLIIAFPVLIIIVGMGFQRQSCAIGIELFALLAMEEKKYFKAILLIIIASTFHYSILFFLPFFVSDYSKNIFKPKNIITLLLLGFFFYITIFKSVEEIILLYFLFYISNVYDLVISSNGVIYRLLPTIIAGLILVFNKSKFINLCNNKDIRIYIRFSYIVFLISFLVFIFPDNTTFLDRFALYTVPLTIFVFNKIIDFKFLNISKSNYHLIFLVSYFIYTFMWLKFAIHNQAFVPYRNLLFL